MSARGPLERLLAPAEAAEVTGTTERLWRRLVAERRVRYVKVGRYVRIPESAVAEFVAAHTVEPGQLGVVTTRPMSRRAPVGAPVRYLGRG